MLIAFASAFVISWCGYRIVLAVFPRLQLTDFPERHGLKRPAVPYPAGVVVVIAALATLAILVPWTMQSMGLGVGILLLAITCFIDDRYQLPAPLRLLVQCIVVGIIVAAGSRIYTITNPLGGIFDLDQTLISLPVAGTIPLLGGLVTAAWLLLCINAMNWCDGVQGQASAVSCIGFLMLGALAHSQGGATDIALVSMTLAGLSAGSLLFELPTVRLLIGDTGAMTYGILLGVLGVYEGGKIATVFLALGMPLVDAGFVSIERLLRGTSPLRGGRDHLHHLLLSAGWSPVCIVFFTTSVGAALGITALAMNTAQKFVGFVLLALLVGLLRHFARVWTRQRA